MPGEYFAIGKVLEDWKPTDVIATASLVGGIFGKGGGNEVQNALVLQAAKSRFGGAAGEQAWRDFRRMDDPEAPTTVQSGNGSFDYPSQRGTSGVALPDEGSVVDPPNSGSGADRQRHHRRAAGRLRRDWAARRTRCWCPAPSRSQGGRWR